MTGELLTHPLSLRDFALPRKEQQPEPRAGAARRGRPHMVPGLFRFPEISHLYLSMMRRASESGSFRSSLRLLLPLSSSSPLRVR